MNWTMKDCDIERPDSDYPGYNLRMTDGENSDFEDFKEAEDDWLDERELSHYDGE